MKLSGFTVLKQQYQTSIKTIARLGNFFFAKFFPDFRNTSKIL